MSEPPRLSIVVPARNAGRTIDACLSSLAAHVPADLREVIVVDNGSTDDTLERVRRHGVTVVSVPSGFVSTVRNAGARQSRYPLLAFIDSDCTVRAGWYEAIAAALQDPSVGVAGCRHELPDRPTWCQRAWQDAQLARARGAKEEVQYVPAGNLAARRELFLTIGGFDEALETGEDPDLCIRVARRGLRILSSPGMRCVHLGEPSTLGAIFRRERWHGRGARLRYSGGRLAPITVVTLLFAAAAGLGAAGVGVGAALGWWWLALGVPCAALIPLMFALRYGRWTPVVIVQLWLVYCAYFLGRAAALPTVFRRAAQSSAGHSRFQAKA